MRAHLRDSSGSVMPLAGLVVAVLAMATAYSVDMGIWHQQRAELQRTVDLAAYSAGVSSLADDDLTAINAMLNYQELLAESEGRISLNATLDADGRIEITGTRPTQQFFSQLLSSQAPTLTVTATIGAPTADPMPCVLALDANPPGDFGIRVTNNSEIDADDCSVHSNSTDTNSNSWTQNGSIYVHSGTITGGSVSAVGDATATSTGASSISPTPETGADRIEDPLADYSPPAATGATQTNPEDYGSWKGNKHFEPGIYPNGFVVNNGNKAQMKAGVYYITGGDFVVTSGAKLQPSNGVTIIMTSNGRVYMSDGASVVNWRAPKSGDTEGIVFYRSPDVDCPQGAEVTGAAKYRFDGLVYLPTCDVVLSNDAQVETRNDFTYLIVNSLDVTGGASLTLKTETTYGVASTFGSEDTTELVLVK